MSFQHFIASAPLTAHSNFIINSAGSAARRPGLKRPTPRRIVRHALLTASIVRVARQKRAHVVHLHGSSHDLSFLANGLSLAAAGLVGARTVWHLHEDLSVVQFPGRRALTRATFARLTGTASRLALLTDKDRTLAARYVPEEKLVIIPPTCSPAMVDVPLARPNGPLRVLFVGWLSEAKGVFDALEVVRRLRDRVPDMQLHLLGAARSADQLEAVKAFVERHRLESLVALCGLVTGAEKERMFADAHLLFSPTHWDAFPVTVLEAMSAGLPVVASRVGGLPLMLEDGRGAYLTEVGDVAAMADRLAELASEPERRAEMGQANRQRFLDHYHPARVGQLAVDVYQQLAAAGPN